MQRNLAELERGGRLEEIPTGAPAQADLFGATCARRHHDGAVLVFYAGTRARAYELRQEHRERAGCA